LSPQLVFLAFMVPANVFILNSEFFYLDFSESGSFYAEECESDVPRNERIRRKNFLEQFKNQVDADTPTQAKVTSPKGAVTFRRMTFSPMECYYSLPL
jgi:hypothetical protein